MSNGGNCNFNILLIILISFLIISCGQKSGNDGKNPDLTIENKTDQPEPKDSIVIELIGIDSLSVFDLLRADHKVVSKSSIQGIFVTGIDGIDNTRDHFWLYSVNDSMGAVAADRYIIGESDRVRWHYRKLSH